MIERGVYHLWAEREAVGEYVDRRGRKRKSYRVVAVSGCCPLSRASLLGDGPQLVHDPPLGLSLRRP